MTADAVAIRLPAVGEVVAGKYKIEKLLGKGGMGAVFLAQHEILRQPVAIKMVLPEVALDPVFVARFMNEARAAAGIRNEHVAQVLDVARLESGAPYMVLEFLEGADLSDIVTATEGYVPVENSVDWVLQALEAVAQAHALGIVHRDLKPANLFLAKKQDGSSVIKVLDFGISKAINPLDVADVAVTSTHALLGSPGYMAPEQIRSSKNVDARADVWSMGVILYKLLTKNEPFTGESFGALFAAVFSDDPIRVRDSRPEVPKELEDVVFRCLKRERDERYANVADLARALAPFASAEGRLSVASVCRTLGVSKDAPVPSPSSPSASRASSPSSPDLASSSSEGKLPAASPGPATHAVEPTTGPGVAEPSSSPRLSSVQTVMDAAVSAKVVSASPPKQKGSAAVKIAAAAAILAVGGVVVFMSASGKRTTGAEPTGLIASDTHAMPSAPAQATAPTMPSATAESLPAVAPSTTAATSASVAPSASVVASAKVAPIKTALAATTVRPPPPKASASAKPKPPDDSVLGGGRN